MNDRPRIRRMDPARDGPMRDPSNMFRGPGAIAAAPVPGAPQSPSAAKSTAPTGVPDASAAPPTFNEEARAGIETAYQVIDQHLREGRLAAQAQAPRDTPGSGAFASAPASALSISTESIQEVVTQGIRFYSSLTPLWAAFLKSLAAATLVRDAAGGTGPALLAPAPMARVVAAGLAPVIVEIASVRMARVTVDLPSSANAPNLAIGGLIASTPGPPPLTEITLAFDPAGNRQVVRIRVPDEQPPGVYSGVIVERESGAARGTVTLRIDG